MSLILDVIVPTSFWSNFSTNTEKTAALKSLTRTPAGSWVFWVQTRPYISSADRKYDKIESFQE